MQNQDDSKLIEYHAEQTAQERHHDNTKKQQLFCVQSLMIYTGVYDGKDQEQRRSHFVYLNAGDRNHNRYHEENKQ